MKRIVLALTAFSILAAPVAAQAQSKYSSQSEYRHRHQAGPSHKPMAHKPAPRPHWSKGKQLSDWKRRPAVRDYHRHGLRRPGPGQQWVRVDNNYLLVNLASGIIAGIVAGR